MSTPDDIDDLSAHKHSRSEDALAIVSGTLLISVGIAFFTTAGLLTGGTAGLAFLLHYATGIRFGPLFFVLNLPFYCVDCAIVLLALFSIEPIRVLYSILGAVALNIVLTINHRPGRYLGM